MQAKIRSRTLLYSYAAINLVILASFLVFYFYVPQNTTFTHANLTDGDVPYYINDDAADPTEHATGRGQFIWGLYGSDVLRIVVPVMVFLQFFIMMHTNSLNGYNWALMFMAILLNLWDIAKLIIRSIYYVNCVSYPFCRNEADPNNADASPSDPFLISFWFNVAYVVLEIVDILLIYAIMQDKGVASDYRKFNSKSSKSGIKNRAHKTENANSLI